MLVTATSSTVITILLPSCFRDALGPHLGLAVSGFRSNPCMVLYLNPPEPALCRTFVNYISGCIIRIYLGLACGMTHRKHLQQNVQSPHCLLWMLLWNTARTRTLGITNYYNDTVEPNASHMISDI